MTSKAIFSAVVGMILLAGVGGCQTGSPEIVGAEAALARDAGSAAFLDRVSSQPTVSENDAMRGVLLLMDGEDRAVTFGQRVSSLMDRGVVPAQWSFQAGRPATKGKLAYMIYSACQMRGGVVLWLTGPSQRYCLREMQYQGVMSEGPVGAEITGMEFAAVLARADAYLQEGKVPQVLRNVPD